MEKRFDKFLLVIPPFYSQNVAYWTTFPAGAGYISEYLTSNNIENDIIDMRIDQDEEVLFKKIVSYKPDLIGFQVLTYRCDLAFSLINKIKERFDINIVIGGPHVSAERSDCLKESLADFAIKMEGEVTLLELINGIKLEDIKGLIYRKESNIIENEDRPVIINLDSIPFPKYCKFELEKYDKSIPIVTSRGCPYSCTFCTVKLTMGKKFRFRTPENIVEEIDFWYQRGYKRFNILDDNFTLITERVLKFCKLMNEKNYKDIDLALPNGIRADRISKELLLMMKGSGFKLFGIGVESGDELILKNINKGESLESIEKAIALGTSMNFDVELFFTIGNQGETKDTVEKSFNLALKYPVADVKFFNVVPFPHTDLYDWVKVNGKLRNDFRKALIFQEAYKGEPFFSTPELSFEDRVELLERARKLRNIVLRKNMSKKLNKFGFIGNTFAHLLYIDFVNQRIKWAYSKKITRKMIKKIIDIFKIEAKHL
jgi:radical SAM superfamily enzyme YgiQ (UPF0313 family)